MADVAGTGGDGLLARPPDFPPLLLTKRDLEKSLGGSPTLSSDRGSRNSIAPPKAARFGRRAYGCGANSLELSPQDFPDGGSTTREYLADQSGECGLCWSEPPTNVFVVKKFRDEYISQCFMQMATYLDKKGMSIFVEKLVLEDKVVATNKDFADTFKRLKGWSPKDDSAEHVLGNMDLVVCLGGDGTLLHISSLFQESVPPVLAFHLGSLGFLTPLSFDRYKETIDQVLKGDDSLDMTLRSRLLCTIDRRQAATPVSQSCQPSLLSPLARADSEPRLLSRRDQNGLDKTQSLKQRDWGRKRQSSIITRYTKTERMLVLNEVVIDRGSSPYLSSLDVYCNNRLITDVQGDGLIVASPTGSTAYAAAAGASMVHPSVQTMVVTPICPHSLSFRPIMVPGGVTMRIVVPLSCRGRGAVSCDGKNRQELSHGDSVSVTMSIWPLPCVNSVDHLADWFNSLAKCLSWNVRQKQKPLESGDDVEPGTEDEGDPDKSM